jgi:hypothetical protein
MTISFELPTVTVIVPTGNISRLFDEISWISCDLLSGRIRVGSFNKRLI